MCIRDSMCIVGFGRKDKGEGPLVNLTDGGDGCSGYIHTPEHKASVSLKLKGQKKPPRTKEHCKNISLAKLGTPTGIAPFKGKHHKEQSKKLCSEALLGRKKSALHKQHMRKPKTKTHADNIRKAKSGTIRV